MKKTLLPLFLLLSSLSAFAQHNFKPGYIIAQNDTIWGLVDQQGDRLSGSKVNFKKSESAPVQTFSPLQVQGFGLKEGFKFETKKLGTGDSTQTHFFTLLVKGKVSLYSFRDKDSKDHFYLLKTDSLQELLSYTVTEERQGRRVVVPYNLFRGTLNQSFTDCPAVMADTKGLPFTQKALINIVSRYNQCSSPATLTYVETPKKSVITWGITVGGATSTLKVQGGTSIDKKDQTLTSSFGPSVGLFLNGTLPWVNPRLSLQGELQYTRNQYSKSFSEQENTFRRDYELNLDLHYLKLPILLRYSFPIKKISPFLSAGLINSYAIKHSQELTTTSSNATQENATVEKAPYMDDFRSYAQSYAVGAGVLFPLFNHQLSVEGRYEKGNGFSSYSSISTNTGQLYFLLGLSF